MDRWGRTRVYLAYLAIFYVLCALLTYALTGDWRTPAGVMRGITCTVVGFGVVLISLGSAEFFSTFLMYPVPSIRKPFSSPQGRAMAQGLFPFAFMLATCVMALPTGHCGHCARSHRSLGHELGAHAGLACQRRALPVARGMAWR